MKVYSKWFISLIVMSVTLFYTIPLFYAATYTFDINRFFNDDNKFLIALLFFMGVAVIIFVYLTLHYRKWKSFVLLQYRKEFAFLLVVSAFGFLGLVVMFVEFGGNPDYVMHLLIGLFILNYAMVSYLGRKFFNIRLMGKQ